MFKDIASFFGFDLVDRYSSSLIHCSQIFDKLIDSVPKNQPRFISKVQAHVTKEVSDVNNKFIVIKFSRYTQIRLFANGTWRFHTRKI